MTKRDDLNHLFEFDISLDTRELFLFSDDIDCNVAANIIKSIKVLERKPGPIIVHQYSLGGDISAGMAIYDAILTSNCPFIFLLYGCAASMGSLIPQAAAATGYRIGMPNCSWLIHEGYISIEDNKRAVHSYIEANSKFINQMYEIYATVCMGSPYFGKDKQSTVKAYLKRKLSSREDWWLSAKEAVEYGFADAIYGSAGYENLSAIKAYFS